MSWIPDCNPCLAENLDAQRRKGLGADVKIPIVYKAATLAPQWQQQVQLGQAMFACVAIPVCKERHLMPFDPNAIQPASAHLLGNGGKG